MPGDLSTLGATSWYWLLDFLPRLLGAVLILTGGFVLARLLSLGLIRLADRTGRLDATMQPVIRSVVRYAIIIIAVVAALGQVGIQTASLLAALAAAGLAIGLALQGTLSNIAAGIMLLWLRPFRTGDFIETTTVAGTVEEINLFTTRIRTWDGIYKFTPNSELWNRTITNFTRNPRRLVLIDFSVGYESDARNGREILCEMAAQHPKVDKDDPVRVVPLKLGDNSVVLQLRAWTSTEDFWDVKWDLTEAGRKALVEAGLHAPFSQHRIQIADMASLFRGTGSKQGAPEAESAASAASSSAQSPSAGQGSASPRPPSE